MSSSSTHHKAPPFSGMIASQSYVVTIFALLAAGSLGLFGTLHILIEHNASLGLVELSGSAAALLNILGLSVTHSISLAKNLLLFIILAFLMVMLVSGGTQDTGAFWFFTFPVSAFFLMGRKGGWYWMLALLGATAGLLGLAYAQVVTLAYDATTIRQLTISLLVVTVGIYAYQQARENMEHTVVRERQKLNQAKDEFLTLASHQLRTPISAIKWSSELLLHGDVGKMTAAQQEYVRQVYSSNQRSASIVDAIITVSHLQAGSLPIQLETHDLPDLCQEVLKGLEADLPQIQNLHLEQHYEAALPKLRCDAALTRTILRNLLSNAVKYTPAGGKVNLTVDRTTEKLKSGSKGSVRIVVADTGYGIPKNQQQKVFAKLFRASNIKTKDTDGTGLGLYIVRMILEQVGGQITFQSQEDKGTTFTVLLPLEGMRAQAEHTTGHHATTAPHDGAAHV